MEDYFYYKEEPDTLSIVREAFEDIKDEIKRILEAELIADDLRIFIEIEEATEQVPINLVFYSPLISIGLLEGYGSYYLQYAVNTEMAQYADPSVKAKLVRCIYKHTSSMLTMKNIEGMVEVHSYSYLPYDRALQAFERGDNRYQPFIIEPNLKEA